MQPASAPTLARRLPAAAAYALMIAASVGAFLAISQIGSTLAAPAPSAAAAAAKAKAAPPTHALLHVLVALCAVIVAGKLISKLLARFHQPAVIGEVIAGIVLGPSLLGWAAPQVSEWLLPQSVAPYLSLVAQLGVILYMFLVGLELNGELLRHRAHTTVGISHASIAAPFLLGSLLALLLYPRLSSSDVSFTSFALFLGAAMSVTAFPVLARIVADRKMTRTELGVIALSCAAADDVTAWCLLALVVGVAQAKLGGAVFVILGALGFIALMFLVVGPALNYWLARSDKTRLTPTMAAMVYVAVLASALATEALGVHAIFGAFLLGAVIPCDSIIAKEFTQKLEEPVTILLLPAFFAVTGMRTEIGLVSGMENWLLCGLVILVATLGKFGGTLAAAKLTGLNWKDSAALGVLMNTRGLMELVVLNIGLDLQVISPTLFAMMVLMAIATTLATSPILSRLVPEQALCRTQS